MDKKTHGPAFNRHVIPLKPCLTCHGKAVIRGVFHQIDCIQCNASGWVREDNDQPLALQDLVTQLSFNLKHAHGQIEQLRNPASTIRGNQVDVIKYYEQNNRRGAGGTNFTGD